jgi:hypothetical protein
LARQVRQEIKPAFAPKFEIEHNDVRLVLFHGRQRFAMAGGCVC